MNAASDTHKLWTAYTDAVRAFQTERSMTNARVMAKAYRRWVVAFIPGDEPPSNVVPLRRRRA